MSKIAGANPMLESTAYWTAAARAKESEREDRLFNDPWASLLAGQVGAEWIAQRAGNVFSTAPMIIRTHYFDTFLERAVLQNAIRQVVILAAGLDTRAFRLNWPDGTRLYELDQPSILQYKAQALQSTGAKLACERIQIELDLTQPWKESLTRSGFDPQRPSVWLLEGFLFYLPNEDIIHILDTVTSLAAKGSWLGFDIVNSLTLTSPITRQWIEMQARSGAPWIGAMDDPESFLAERGWRATMTQSGAEDANYGRWTLPVIPVKMAGMPHNWYVTAYKE